MASANLNADERQSDERQSAVAALPPSVADRETDTDVSAKGRLELELVVREELADALVNVMNYTMDLPHSDKRKLIGWCHSREYYIAATNYIVKHMGMEHAMGMSLLPPALLLDEVAGNVDKYLEPAQPGDDMRYFFGLAQ